MSIGNIEITESFSVEVVTPERAKELVSNNYEGNRNVRKSYVEQLANVMRSGRYISQNGQTLVQGIDDGVLYDGQHRCHAVILSGVPQVFGIARIRDGKEAYKTIDNGTRRTAADFLRVPSRTAAASVGKVMACVEWGEAPLLSCLQGKFSTKVQVDRGIIVDYVNQNAAAVTDAVRRAGTMRTAIAASSVSVYAVFAMLVRFCETDACLNAFIEDFLAPAPESKTVTALKMTIIKSFASAKKPATKWILGTLLDGYTHFCEQDGSTMLNKQSIRLSTYQKYVEAMRARHTNDARPLREADR